MQPKKINIVCFSPTGTSRRVAEAIANAMAGTTTDAAAAPAEIRAFDLTHAPAAAATLSREEVALFTVPVYGGHPAPEALNRMRELRGDATPAVIVVVYGNRAFDHAAKELAAFVAERGFRPVAAAAFVGEHSYSSAATPIAAGRPDASDLAQAAAFGAAISGKLAGAEVPTIDIRRLKTPATPLLSQLRFIGFVLGYMWRQRRNPAVDLPEGDAARCTHCGRCAAACPVQAITRGEETRTDAARCIRCCACVKGCPVGAHKYDSPFAAPLARNFALRKPPVTLL